MLSQRTSVAPGGSAPDRPHNMQSPRSTQVAVPYSPAVSCPGVFCVRWGVLQGMTASGKPFPWKQSSCVLSTLGVSVCLCAHACARTHAHMYGGVHTCSWHVLCELLCTCVSSCVRGHVDMHVCAWLWRRMWRADRQFPISRLVCESLMCPQPRGHVGPGVLGLGPGVVGAWERPRLLHQALG